MTTFPTTNELRFNITADWADPQLAHRIRRIRTPSQEVISVFREWQRLSHDLWRRAVTINCPEAAIYHSAYEASQAFIRQCSIHAHSPWKNEQFWRLCYDQNNHLQGAMFLSPAYASHPDYHGLPYVVIELIMTHPSNIDSPLLHTARTIRGVGTALIREAERICIREGADGLIVQPDPSSIPFYHNLGFQQNGNFLVKTPAPRLHQADGRVAS